MGPMEFSCQCRPADEFREERRVSGRAHLKTNDRPYRKVLTIQNALNEHKKFSNVQF